MLPNSIFHALLGALYSMMSILPSPFLLTRDLAKMSAQRREKLPSLFSNGLNTWQDLRKVAP